MPVIPAAPTPVIEADALSVSLGGIPVLRDISMQVNPGEVVALVGANGSGKTTLLRALLGLVPHQHGEIRLFGTRLAAFHNWRQVGYVPQATSISVQQATVWEVAVMGRLAHRRMFFPMRASDRRQVLDALALVGLVDQSRRQFVHLSGGQQQRVLIARALASAADFFIMDEPLTGVDLITQAALAEVVSKLTSMGKTCLFVLHETGPFAPLIDRTIVLHDGRVVPGSRTTHVHATPKEA